jgi:hypothetical protein
MSVYSHFLARGRDVVYPKDMSMILDLGTRKEQAGPDGTVHVPAEPPPQPSKNTSTVIPAQSRTVSLTVIDSHLFVAD